MGKSGIIIRGKAFDRGGELIVRLTVRLSGTVESSDRSDQVFEILRGSTVLEDEIRGSP
jgi:hypothetical protein